ncbi:hypothetical protein TanjilG_17642 [Lupinus angustifolius]|uniref:Uncharacterized protein n=1 Tax=Lupinus angustifolius TaxID=3871 RepID=A0A1J7HK05_LUPAN|nr:hypothetical protein TanjilG_17642 [Lupinus angustifolius]
MIIDEDGYSIVLYVQMCNLPLRVPRPTCTTNPTQLWTLIPYDLHRLMAAAEFNLSRLPNIIVRISCEKQLMRPVFSPASRHNCSMESFETNHCHCMMTNDGLSSRTPDKNGVNTSEEDHFPTEDGVAVDRDNINCPSQGDLSKDGGKKHVEST